MNNSTLKKILLLFFLISLTIRPCDAQIFHRNPEKQLYSGSHSHRKMIKAKAPGKVLKAKKKQEANDRRLKRDYDKSVKQSQERTVEIQTPEVQARMKQNKKDYTTRDKANQKKVKSATKKAGKKYN